MIQAVALALSCLVALGLIVVWAPASEHRPRHADAGLGALTVAQLRAQVGATSHSAATDDEQIEWPTVDPDDPRLSLDTLHRVLDGLRGL